MACGSVARWLGSWTCAISRSRVQIPAVALSNVKVGHTHIMCLCRQSVISAQTGKVAVGLASHWPCVTDNSIRAHGLRKADEPTFQWRIVTIPLNTRGGGACFKGSSMSPSQRCRALAHPHFGNPINAHTVWRTTIKFGMVPLVGSGLF